MNFGSVCSGIEAASVAFAPLGWKAAWVAEIEPFPAAVLAHHYPYVPNLGDMTTIARRVLTGEVPAPESLWGGTPCQAFSVAGLRQSLADERGNLTLKFVELADAIDHVRARRGERECIIGWENVPGVLSTKDNAFGCFLAGLAGEDEPLQPPGEKWANAGAVYGPARAVAWRTLDAQYFGVAQRRRRVFVVASARNGFDPAQVLFEWDGLRRDTAPSREAGKVAPTIPSRSTAGGGLGTDFDCDGGLIQAFGGNNQSGPIDQAAALNANRGCHNPGDFEAGTLLVQETAHTLRGAGFDASEDGTGRGTPLVPVGVTIHGTDPTVQKVASYSDVAQCLRARTPGNIDNSSTTVVQQPVLAFDTTQVTSVANRSNPKPGDPCHPLAAGAHAPAIAFPANLSGTQHASTENLSPALGALNPTGVAYTTKLHNTQSNQAGKVYEEYSTSLDRSSPPPALLTAMQVRRLTPTECERLQGFPDDYTLIPWRKKPAGDCPDGPRYKALGNSWAVPVARWIGQRIQKHIEQTT
ncbi:DNA cytosine methyltransferase [Acidovorax sp. BL-A-41-H1]|uniref:DNA cytosine methyltransferase n=1 Tax=Acidovorax sp. BL-A-41-H1 TaxID=3421102 RepID=UPI003F7B19EB